MNISKLIHVPIKAVCFRDRLDKGIRLFILYAKILCDHISPLDVSDSESIFSHEDMIETESPERRSRLRDELDLEIRDRKK